MDTSEHGPEDQLTDLERRLAQWRPSTGGLDRDRMLFEAGRAAARSELRGWVPLASSAALALVAVGLGLLLVNERGHRQALEVRIAQQSPAPTAPLSPIEPAPTIVERPVAPDSYLALTHRMLALGLDDAPEPSPRASDGHAPSNPEPTLRVRGEGGLLKF